MIIMSCVFMFLCLPVISLLYILVHNYYYCLQSKQNVNYSAGACVISLDFNVNLWHQSFSSLENLAEQEKLWCQFFCQGLVCQN